MITTLHIAGLVHSKKEFKEKIMAKLPNGPKENKKFLFNPAVFKSYGTKKKKDMTKLYLDDAEHLGRLGQSDRETILSEVWSAKKTLIDGKWYVELSEVAEIIGS